MEKIHTLLEAGLYNDNSLHLQRSVTYIRPQSLRFTDETDRTMDDSLIPFSADEKISHLEI